MKRFAMPVLCALAMSVGWGFRGDYGHEWGAMVPGALLGLSVCLTSGREDWWKRASLLAMLGAIGWAFGGKMSYAKITGYTAHTSFPDVAYGYACLFAIGALWAGIGAAVLGLGITRARSYFDAFAWPLTAIYLVWKCLEWIPVWNGRQWMSATAYLMHGWNSIWEHLVGSGHAPVWFHYQPMNHDTSWVAATAALLVAAVLGLVLPRSRPACVLILILSAFWWLGLSLFVGVLGWRMTPPRSDNWAGVLGLYVGLVVYLLGTRNRAALSLSLYGLLAGGIGFAVTDLLNMLGRAQWGPIGRYEMLQGLDYWKWMEQGFGLLMGLGVGLGCLRVLRGNLAPPSEDSPGGPSRWLALTLLLVVMMWENLFKNVRNWYQHQQIQESLFGLDPRLWFGLVGAVLTCAVVLAICRYLRGELPLVPSSAFGRAQLLFLLILWVAVIAAFMQAFPGMSQKGVLLVHASFWLTAGACTLLVLGLRERPIGPGQQPQAADDTCWFPRWWYWGIWACIPVLIWALARLTVAAHEQPLPGSHLRFESGRGKDQA
ncbi:MAG TPA: hypothetical protein VGY66_03710 [Gemmataceae bacterium]|nr:hypothetical protein [Gemmataceae bacterium]